MMFITVTCNLLQPNSTLTNKFGGLVLPLVDEVLEGLPHGVEEFVVPLEAGVDHVIQLLLELQQFAHHRLVALRLYHYRTTFFL